MGRHHTIEDWACPLLIGAFVLISLTFSLIVPLGEAPDEVPHFSYVQYLLLHQRLPSSEGEVAGEARQPPLYYLLGALATSWIPNGNFQVIGNPDFVIDDPTSPPNPLLHTRQESFPYRDGALVWHIVRALSVLMGAVTVWATWRTALELAPGQRIVALGAASFVAFLPEFTFLSGAVNNDNLIVMLSSLAVLQTVRMLRRPWNKRDALILGLLLGLAPLAKWSGLILWPFSGLLLVWRSRGPKWRKAVLPLVLCFSIAIVIVMPWSINNWMHYGDPLGWSLALSVTDLRKGPMTLGDWNMHGRGLFTSFFGRFGGGLNIHSPLGIYLLLAGAALLGVIGWVREAFQLRRREGSYAVLGVFGLFWGLLLVAYLRWTFSFAGTDAGRLLFPGLPLLAILLASGVAQLFAKRNRPALVAWSGVWFAASLFILVYLVSFYQVPPQDARALLPLRGPSAPADFDGKIRVMDFRVERTRVKPNERVMVHVRWQALKNLNENYWLLLQADGHGETVANKNGAPSAGRVTTDWWRKGQVYTSEHYLLIPPDVAPGTYILRLGLHPFKRWNWLTVRGQEMLTLGTIQVTPPQ